MFLQLDEIVTDERPVCYNQVYITCYATVIEPVIAETGHPILKPLVIDPYNNGVYAWLNQAAYFELERSESTFMRTNYISIEIYTGHIIYCTEMQKQPLVSCRDII